MHPKFEVVRTEAGFSVKSRLRKGGKWFTVADTYCLPEGIMAMTADEAGKFIAAALNREADKRLAKKLGAHFFNDVGHCEFCGLHHEETKISDKCPELTQTAGWVSVLRCKPKTA